MTKENGNGQFRKWVFGALATVVVIWLSWASFSITNLNTRDAVKDTQFQHIQAALCEIKTMLTKHLEEKR